MKVFAFLLLGFIASYSFAQEDTSQTFGDYEVHYSVFNSSFITPDIAKAYGIVRSKSQALVNIAVLKKQLDGSMQAVSAVINGDVFDLVHRANLEFSEVREQDSVYYLANFDISHKIKVYFTVIVQSDPNTSPFKVTFNRTLYKDE